MLARPVRTGKKLRVAYTVVWLGGVSIGGAASGLLAWLILGALVPSTTWLALPIVGAVCVVILVSDVVPFGPSLPRLRRQVNPDVRNAAWRRAIFRFGFELGTGVLTTATSSLILLTLSLAATAPSLFDALMIGSAFGVGRGLYPLHYIWWRTDTRGRRVLIPRGALMGGCTWPKRPGSPPTSLSDSSRLKT